MAPQRPASAGLEASRSFEFRPGPRVGPAVVAATTSDGCPEDVFTTDDEQVVALEGVHGPHARAVDSGSSCAGSCRGLQAQPSFRLSDSVSVASFQSRSSSRGPEQPTSIEGLPAMPDCFRCPVSLKVMEDPVRLSDGRVCERANVARLGYSGEVRPDEHMKDAIRGYFELRREAEVRHDEWKAFVNHREERVAKKLLVRQRQAYGLRILLDQSRQAVRDLKDRRRSASTSCLSTEASSQEEASSEETPRSSDAAAAEEEPHFRSGPAPRAKAEAAEQGVGGATPRPPRRSGWSGFFAGRRAAHA